MKEDLNDSPLCTTCNQPAVGFIREAVEQIPSSLEEQYAGIRRFKPGEKFFYCRDHFPK